MKLLKQFIQQETVLTAAAVLAVVSAFFVLPDAQYLGYIDLRTLAILFSLMTVMAGLRRQGFFDGLGRALLSRTHSTLYAFLHHRCHSPHSRKHPLLLHERSRLQ